MDIPELGVRITVENIRNISSFCSPEFVVRGLPWKIQVFKRKDASLSVYVKCEKKDNSAAWTCMAHCKFKLISFSQQPHERSFKEPREFSAKQRSYGYLKFIELKDLFDPAKNYIENGSIVLEIKLKANAFRNLSENLASTELMSDEMKKCFRLTIKNMSDFTGFYSPEIYVRGIPWRIKVYTTKIMNTSTIAITLNCVYSDNFTDWSCKARAVFRLNSNKSSKAPNEWTFKQVYDFTRNSNAYGNKRFITWKDLMEVDNQYIQNDSIVLDVELIVQKPVNAWSFETVTCPICLHNLIGRPIASTFCGHVYCKLCIEKAIEQRNICPVCNQHLILAQIHPIYLS